MLQRAHTCKVGTPRYWAPEVVECLYCSVSHRLPDDSGTAPPPPGSAEVPAAVYDERCDIYSAGLILWFLLTGRRPSANVMLDPRARPSPGPAYRRWPAAAELAEKMWAHDPHSRPSAAEALACVCSMGAAEGGGPGCAAGCVVA
jgi:serine/threonine protein kinase